jgi:hypothetical protein
MGTSFPGRKPQPCKHTTTKNIQVISPEKQPSALLGCHSTLSLPRAGTVYIRTIKSRRDKVTNKTGWHIHELVEQDVQTLSNVNYKLLSHDLLLPLVGRELSDQISVTAK